jgi:hypothetical protein
MEQCSRLLSAVLDAATTAEPSSGENASHAFVFSVTRMVSTCRLCRSIRHKNSLSVLDHRPNAAFQPDKTPKTQVQRMILHGKCTVHGQPQVESPD